MQHDTEQDIVCELCEGSHGNNSLCQQTECAYDIH